MNSARILTVARKPSAKKATRATKPEAASISKQAAKTVAKPTPKKQTKRQPKTAKRPRGAQTKFSDALAAEIVERLGKGETMSSICSDAHTPSVTTVWNWCQSNVTFADSIARARDLGYDALADGALEIADDARNDWMLARDDQGEGYRINGEHVQRSKLRIWTRLQLLAKWNPKKYGERVAVDAQVNHGGMSDEALVSRLNALGVDLTSVGQEPADD